MSSGGSVGVSNAQYTTSLPITVVELYDGRPEAVKALTSDQQDIIASITSPVAGSIKSMVVAKGGDTRLIDVSNTTAPTKDADWVQDAWAKLDKTKIPTIAAATKDKRGLQQQSPKTLDEAKALLQPLLK